MIKIIDEFFDKPNFELVKDFALHKAFYSPQFFDNAVEKNQDSHYGNRFFLKDEPKLLDLFKKQTELKFKIKIKELYLHSGIDQRTLSDFKPHTDNNSVLNVLIMISGPTALSNGTVFYTDGDLDIHVGFRENRAIFFPSNKWHSPHANKEFNITRYSATLFIKDYEE